MKRKSYIKLIIFIVALFNITDAVLTDYLVGIGAAYEANPICKYLLEQGSLEFYAVKIGIGSLLLLLLYSMFSRTGKVKRSYTVIINIMFFIYLALVVNGLLILFITT